MTGRPTPLRALVVGAGFGGLAAAIELRRAGVDVTVLERGDTVGGVWRENTYPGAACDVPSPYYAFSYETSRQWPRRYSRQPDILAYLDRVAGKYGVRERTRFGTEVTAADWDAQRSVWTVRADGPDGPVVVETDVLVCAVGQLSRPALPGIEGREEFTGTAFHSAQWRHDVDLRGKRVAVVGTGASAIQFVPEIAGQVGRLHLFQRTPPHILPRPDRAFDGWRRARVPQRIERAVWWTLGELLTVAFLYAKPLSRLLTAWSRWHMRRSVDEETFARVWPTYPIGCKRVLFSDDYLPALVRPNVELVTERVERITPTGVRTGDGTERDVDVIIYGTGFTANDFLAPLQIRGVDGRDLRASWRDGARAYLGVSAPGFPNLFLMYGPNTNLGSGSIVTMLEAQARYVRQAVRHITTTGRALDVRADVEVAFDEATQARLVDGVWSQCSSWYRTASGRVATNWPGTVSEYRLRTARFDPTRYVAVPLDVPTTGSRNAPGAADGTAGRSGDTAVTGR